MPITIHIGSKADDQHHWQFSVSDNGIGIPDKYFDKIFQIYQSLNPRTEFDGNGIGLANCKKISEIHSGQIWVESQVGQGSTFYFSILKSLKDDRTSEVYHAN